MIFINQIFFFFSHLRSLCIASHTFESSSCDYKINSIAYNFEVDDHTHACVCERAIDFVKWNELERTQSTEWMDEMKMMINSHNNGNNIRNRHLTVEASTIELCSRYTGDRHRHTGIGATIAIDFYDRAIGAHRAPIMICVMEEKEKMNKKYWKISVRRRRSHMRMRLSNEIGIEIISKTFEMR